MEYAVEINDFGYPNRKSDLTLINPLSDSMGGNTLTGNTLTGNTCPNKNSYSSFKCNRGYSNEIQNDQFLRNVGLVEEDPIDAYIFNEKNIRKMSDKITQLLTGVDRKNRPIIVPDKTISSVLSGVRKKFVPEVGNIYSRYNTPNYLESGTQRIINEAINIIVTDVRNNLETDECNQKLNIWTTVLGDFNEHGLRSHGQIKIREKRPSPMLFNMNY
jgi:hypothetical protein